jgi:tetratricopeptide (TPR) repeat protein
MERNQAWGLFLAARGQEAVVVLERQLQAIEEAGGSVRQQALCQSYLGRIWAHARQPQRALAPLEKAIAGFRAASDSGNMAVALGDKGHALRQLGRLSEALLSVEQAVALFREQGDTRNEAAGLGHIAEIFANQHRFGEAEQRYEEALMAAQRAGDKGVEGTTLQHLGHLADQQGQHTRAVTRYKDALARFQAAEDRAQEMRTAHLLGTAEMELDHHEAARAWYTEAERLARDLGDNGQIATTAQNVGILLQQQALALPKEAEAERLRLLAEAAASVTKSLAIQHERSDEVGAAISLHGLSVIHRHLGALDAAERYAQEALSFYEPHDLPDVWRVYGNLEDIAVARGHTEEAAAWRGKKEAKRAELRRLAQGDAPPRLPPQARDACLAVSRALHASRTAGQSLPPNVANAIATLTARPNPDGPVGRFLQRIAAGDLPELPPGLPPELADIFDALLEALRTLPSTPHRHRRPRPPRRPCPRTPSAPAAAASPSPPATAPATDERVTPREPPVWSRRSLAPSTPLLDAAPCRTVFRDPPAPDETEDLDLTLRHVSPPPAC